MLKNNRSESALRKQFMDLAFLRKQNILKSINNVDELLDINQRSVIQQLFNANRTVFISVGLIKFIFDDLLKSQNKLDIVIAKQFISLYNNDEMYSLIANNNEIVGFDLINGDLNYWQELYLVNRQKLILDSNNIKLQKLDKLLIQRYKSIEKENYND